MIKLKYKNNKLEKIFNDENEMKKYFKNDKLLVNGLQALIFHFDRVDSIYDFINIDYLKGYNLEKIKDLNYYSIRVVPKKNKRKDRVILLVISSDGKNVEIIDIDSEHRYNVKK